MRRARSLAPDSSILAGHLWSLRDVQRAGGQLSPILEEGGNESADEGWTPDKELRLVQIAKRLHPSPITHREALFGSTMSPAPCDSAAPTGVTPVWSPASRMRRNAPAPFSSGVVPRLASQPVVSASAEPPRKRWKPSNVVAPLRRPQESQRSAHASEDTDASSASAVLEKFTSECYLTPPPTPSPERDSEGHSSAWRHLGKCPGETGKDEDHICLKTLFICQLFLVLSGCVSCSV